MKTNLRNPNHLTRKRKSLALILTGCGALIAVAAIAGPPVLPPLNPPAPSYYACAATGSGAICRGQQVTPFDQEPTGIICGTAQNPVELLVSGINTLRATRYYDTAGNLARRFRYETFEGIIINPVTGLTAKATTITDLIDTFAVPGNFDTMTTQQTGPAKFMLSANGVLLLDTGRVLFDSQENVISQSGHLAVLDYFSGNPEAAAKLCAALGSPGTP